MTDGDDELSQFLIVLRYSDENFQELKHNLQKRDIVVDFPYSITFNIDNEEPEIQGIGGYVDLKEEKQRMVRDCIDALESLLEGTKDE